MSADGQARPGRLLWRAYLILVNLLVLALLGELAVRVWGGAFGSAAEAADGAAKVERVGYQLHPFQQMVNPPRQGVDPGPDFAGWRVDPPEAGRTAGRTRIMFLGGAATDYPLAVRAALEPTLGPVTVYDFGANWHSSLHSLYKFWTYVDEIQPDLVVVQHNIEDFYRGFTPPRYSLPQYRADYSHYAGPLSLFWTPAEGRADGRPVFHAQPAPRVVADAETDDGSLSGLVDSVLAGSELLRVLRGEGGARGTRRAGGAGGGAPGERPEDQHTIMFAEQVLRSLPAFERNLGNLQHGCRTKQVRVLFLTMPFRVQVPDKTYILPGRLMTNDDRQHMLPADFEFGLQAFNEAVLKLSAPKFSYVLDLAPSLSDRELFEDEVHLTEPGQRRQGDLVAGFILEQGLLPLPE